MNFASLMSATFAAAALALPAFAAGPGPAPADPVIAQPAPAPAPARGDWTGPYAGAALSFGDISSDPAGVNGDGALYGLRFGYDYDFGSFVLGAGVDYDFAEIGVGGGNTLDSVARLRLRAGYDIGNTLLFGSAGLARAETTLGGASVDDTGYVVGIGAEHRLSQAWSLTGEVLYHRFDDFDATGIDVEATTVSAGVNFRF